MRYLFLTLVLVTWGVTAQVESTKQKLIPVNSDNYVEAKTALHFQRVLKRTGGMNRFFHLRKPTPLDQQRVTRMNRDTLYSSAIVDISKGATLHLPDSGNRYLSAAIVNEHHYVNDIFHDEGTYKLEPSRFGSDFVMIVVRVFVNANDDNDIQSANALQDLLQINSHSARPYVAKPFAPQSLKAATTALMTLGGQMPDARDTYGPQNQVNPIRHLLGAAYGWGGLPESEVVYLNVQPAISDGAFKLTVTEVPVDGFWSVSVYNEAGYFEQNSASAYSINNYTAMANKDGSITIHFGGDPANSNYLPITKGWNYVVRMYRPHQSVIDGDWFFPEIKQL